MGPVAGFFELVGFLTHRGILDQDMVWSEFSYFVVYYFAALKDAIQREREHEQAPTLYTEFERLYAQMHALDTQQRGPDATPTPQRIRDFVENEPNN